MNSFHSFADGEVSISAVPGQIWPHCICSSPTLYPIHMSHVSISSRAWCDEAFQGTENSLPPPCFMLYLCLLPPVTEVCCFHRKLACLPLRWMLGIARYLLVKVFSRLCVCFLLSLSCSHSPHQDIWPRKNQFHPHQASLKTSFVHIYIVLT